mmetsp:Transcript_5378/g.13416  ORF Transcript_5378/g.13416 Transcript_5378/m.13416 type:complete len:269 (-) Transcript_5378:1552-2358(-)
MGWSHRMGKRPRRTTTWRSRAKTTTTRRSPPWKPSRRRSEVAWRQQGRGTSKTRPTRPSWHRRRPRARKTSIIEMRMMHRQRTKASGTAVRLRKLAMTWTNRRPRPSKSTSTTKITGMCPWRRRARATGMAMMLRSYTMKWKRRRPQWPVRLRMTMPRRRRRRPRLPPRPFQKQSRAPRRRRMQTQKRRPIRRRMQRAWSHWRPGPPAQTQRALLRCPRQPQPLPGPAARQPPRKMVATARRERRQVPVQHRPCHQRRHCRPRLTRSA